MRFDRIEILVKHKGKVVWGYNSETVAGRLDNPRLDVLKDNLEAAVCVIRGDTELQTRDGIWKKTPGKVIRYKMKNDWTNRTFQGTWPVGTKNPFPKKSPFYVVK